MGDAYNPYIFLTKLPVHVRYMRPSTIEKVGVFCFALIHFQGADFRADVSVLRAENTLIRSGTV